MINLPHLSEEKKLLVSRVHSALSPVPGLVAIALGGSHASGRATATSDLDFGLSYRESAPFSIDRIAQVAHKLAADGSPVVVGFNSWGPWVNAGAWITILIGNVDFLYRNVNLAERTINDTRSARI